MQIICGTISPEKHLPSQVPNAPQGLKVKRWFLESFVNVIYLNRRASAAEVNDIYRTYVNISGEVYSCCHFTLTPAVFSLFERPLKSGLVLLRYQFYGLRNFKYVLGLVSQALMGEICRMV